MNSDSLDTEITNECANNKMIYSMSIALQTLELTPKEYQTEEYHEIYNSIKQFIEKNCIHQIEYDSIDISPDCSKTIRYCLKCEKTFN